MSGLSQEQLLKALVAIPYRPKKDPRDLKVLDPACGSGHFLLYCFDLLLAIYVEAWGDEQSPKSEVTGGSLREDYPSLEALRLEYSRLDPPPQPPRHRHRSAARPDCGPVALDAWSARIQRVRHQPRPAPAIRKTNIVVAEPMPGERDMLDGFLRSLREDQLESLMRKALGIPDDQRVQATKAMADSLCRLVETAWEKMRLAGEAGSLLKIEEELASAIEKGRDEWEEKLPLFRVTEYSLGGRGNEKYYRHLPEDGQDFWDKAEILTLRAIEEYAASSRNGDQFRRRMFAEDAMRGFAFIDLCRKGYDAILMNPPFGESSKLVRSLLDKQYPRTKNDLYAAFVEMGLRRVRPRGSLGAITSRTGFFLSSFQKWREEILLREAEPTVFADLGCGVLDTAMVETAAYCLRKAIQENDLGGDHGQDVNSTTLAPLNLPQHI